ncbi:sigma 54-interacting transcriptional regulator [Paludibaculum fermentans]|uniref:sigma 54-interacting transcriptional regulator n=1 Tax=Paludibaculum fermentans TaxID=1473598 RepID=UPI003EBF29F2
MEIPDSEIYRALFDLSQVVAGHADLETVCNSLAASLRQVVPFDFLALVLHDPVKDQLRLHAISANRPYKDRQRVIDSRGEDPGARVWREQIPMVLSPLEQETRWGDLVQEALDEGIHAMVLVPLSNGERRLGLLGFGFGTPFQPDQRALQFFQRVAAELAVSVEGYLTRQALLHERDRMRVLFEITNSLVSKLPMEELFSAISTQLSSVVAHDFVLMALLEKTSGHIHLTALHCPAGMLFEPEEISVSPQGMPAGEAISTGRPVVLAGDEHDRFTAPVYRKYRHLGFQSSCSIPLVGTNGISGVLDLGRRSGQPFTPDEVDLLVQVARQIAIATENALAYRELSELRDKLATEKLYLEDEIRFDQNVGSMIGEGPAFQAVLSGIQVVAPTDATVLIEGETGTGKELVARALHDLSGRCKRSFIKVNCAAIPATLLESELFGHEKGSFTGAFAQKIGRFELAHQGTLFLDEVGEIPLELQSKLLRAIQEQELERLGGNRTIRVNVRFVAATNRGLKKMVEEGKFRSDLYYRLHVFPLTVPPLRERKEDIPLLIRYFTQKYATRMNRPIESIPSSTIEALTNYDWPGNIRELQNVIERSVILSPGRVLVVTLPEISKAAPPPRTSRIEESVERDRILRALRATRGKVAGPHGAASLLGLRRTTLQSRMKKLSIEREYN